MRGVICNIDEKSWLNKLEGNNDNNTVVHNPSCQESIADVRNSNKTNISGSIDRQAKNKINIKYNGLQEDHLEDDIPESVLKRRKEQFANKKVMYRCLYYIYSSSEEGDSDDYMLFKTKKKRNDNGTYIFSRHIKIYYFFII